MVCSNTGKYILFGVGTVLVAVGGLVGGLWPTIYQDILKQQLALTTSSKSFEMWQETPIPMYIDFYLFNWTNPHEIKNKSVKPHFTELGPYVFREKHIKVNLSWNDDDTVKFHQIRVWNFEPDLSNGSLNDSITNVNVIPMAAAYMMRYDFFMTTMLHEIFTALKVEMTVTKTVGQLLFDGYDDSLLDLIRKINSTEFNIPFDKFGWFYGRNNSWSFDGVFEMHTGVKDLKNLGVLTKWNNVSQTDYYSSYCAMVNGTTGELWPPTDGEADVSLFATDLCRSLNLNYQGKREMLGLSGNYYTGGHHMVDNGQLFPDNKCFCGSDDYEDSCIPTGLTNVSKCRFGAPAFVSYPHFYLADPVYLAAVDGLVPNNDTDIFSLTLEPETGLPLDVEAKLQINMLLQPSEMIGIYRDVPKEVFIPALWFNQHATLTPELASQLKTLKSLPLIGEATLFSLCGVGVLILLGVLYMSVLGSWSRRTSDQVTLINDDVSAPPNTSE